MVRECSTSRQRRFASGSAQRWWQMVGLSSARLRDLQAYQGLKAQQALQAPQEPQELMDLRDQ
jgi:hypothetical protein